METEFSNHAKVIKNSDCERITLPLTFSASLGSLNVALKTPKKLGKIKMCRFKCLILI